MTKQVSEVVLDGKRYISAKRAAEISGYANDYIGQLCRSGKLESTRIGRNWYVGELSIIGHKNSTQKELNKGILHKQINTNIYSSPPNNGAKSLRSSLAVYSNDEGVLLPNLYRNEADMSTVVPIKIKKSIKIEKEPEKVHKKENKIKYQPIRALRLILTPRLGNMKTSSSYFSRPTSLIKSNELFEKILISSMVSAIIFIGIVTLKNEQVMSTLEYTYSGIFDKTNNISASVLQENVVQPYGLIAKMVNNKVNSVISGFFD